MIKTQCKDCQYYLQHFALGKQKLIRVYCGHCTFRRAKAMRPDAKTCENYIPGSAPENEFATKEYLSKELLRYVLSLELLPEIEEQE